MRGGVLRVAFCVDCDWIGSRRRVNLEKGCMMKAAEINRQLRTVLVELYPTIDDIVRVAHDAGVALERVGLGGSAVNCWDGLLTEAAKNQQVADLLDVARQEYGGNDALAAVTVAFVAAQAVRTHALLPDQGLRLLNFGRELTAMQQQQIEQRLGERVHEVIALATRFDDERPYGPQCIALLDHLGWSKQEWETHPLLLIPPGFAPAALTLISLIHGRRGHFPAMVRIRPETAGLQTTYVLSEIVNLQALRHAAHSTAH